MAPVPAPEGEANVGGIAGGVGANRVMGDVPRHVSIGEATAGPSRASVWTGAFAVEAQTPAAIFSNGIASF